MTITQKRLKEVLDYNPETGVFVWKKRISVKSIIGREVGSINKLGYVQISIEKVKYLAHRLAFLWMMGKFPKEQADHINKNRADNSWKNLREASNMENSWNCVNRRSYRKSKYKGLWFWKKRNKWQVKIKSGDIRRTVGYFVSEETAAKAYDKAAIELHGEFASLNFPERESA